MGQVAAAPPSTGKTSPVIIDEASLARKTSGPTRSPRLTDPLHGKFRVDLFHETLVGEDAGGVHVGLEPAGSDGIDADAAGDPLAGQVAGQGGDGAFGRAISGVAAAHAQQSAAKGRHVDDVAALLVEHDAAHRLAHPKDAVIIHFRELPHGLGGDFGGGDAGGDAGDVDQDVQAAEVLVDLPDNALDGGLVGHVAAVGDGPAAQGRDLADGSPSAGRRGQRRPRRPRSWPVPRPPPGPVRAPLP